MSTVRRLVGSAVIGALAVAGCTGSGSADGDPDRLTVATSFTIQDLVPLDSGFWAPEFGYGDLLMRPLPGGEVGPWVLESLDVVDDTSWELRMREGVTFQNGNPLDAEVLADLMAWHLEHNTAVAPLLQGADVEADGDLTVRLTTERPVPNLPSLLAHEAYFILFDLPTFLEHQDRPADLIGADIYVGPYTVTGLTGDEMSLVRTEDYYGGEPPLEAVTVRFVPDPDSRVRSVRSGEADLALYPPTSAARQLDGGSDGHYLIEPAGEATGGMQLFVNQQRPPLDDPDVRRAIQLAVDYESIADEVMNGLYDRSTGLYPTFLPYARDGLVTDPAAAEDLLDAAGWERDGNGVRTRDGDELTLRFLTYPQQPDVAQAAVALQDQLRSIGVDLRLVEVDDINETLGDEDAWELGVSMNSSLGMTGTDPLALLVTYYHSDGERNHGGVDDPELDDLIDEALEELDEDRRHELLDDIQEILVEERAYGWYLAFKRTPVVVAPALEDYPVPVANLWMTPYEPTAG